MPCISDTGHRFLLDHDGCFEWDIADESDSSAVQPDDRRSSGDAGRFHIDAPCNEVVVRGSHHSERHDEVFYDEGPSCDATLHTTYVVDDVTGEDGHSLDRYEYEDFVQDEADELHPKAIDELMARLPMEDVEADDFPQEFTVSVLVTTAGRYAAYEYDARFVREYTEVTGE